MGGAGPVRRRNYGGFGVERENDIYLRGMIGEEPSLPLGYSALEKAARDKLLPEAFDYVAGGAGAEETVASNTSSFNRWRIVPRTLAPSAERDTSAELLGLKIPAPLLLAPVGVLSIVHPDGELAAARAASALGIPFVLSTSASHTIEEVAAVMGDSPRLFQLYYGRDPDVNFSLVSRAESSGYSGILVTADTRFLGWRPRDLSRGYLPFLKGEGVANFLSDPVFRGKLDNPPEEDMETAVVTAAKSTLDPSFGWKELDALRSRTKLPLILKGVLGAADASRAVEVGVDGVSVSNHGGRQLDGEVSSLEALPEVVDAVGGRVPVLFDSGVRTGSDALKALALGARAVMVGRPYVWGLALKGEEGVRWVLENLIAEFDLSLALSGRSSASSLDRGALRRSER